ncbi:MAG: calcium-binding protein [Gemmatimonadaceae bacterium]
MKHDDRDEERRQCGLCGEILRPCDSISVADVGVRCYPCFNGDVADRLGIDFDNAPIAPVTVADLDGVPHRFQIRSMLVATGHAMYAREVKNRGAEGGYRFEILGDFEADAQDLIKLLRDRIRQGLSVRHVQQTEHGWQLTEGHRLRGVIEWDPDTEGALPLLIVDGRTFTWNQIGRMLMTFEGFTLNAIVQDTIEVVGGPLADGRLETEASPEPVPAVPAAAVRRRPSNRRAAKRRRPTRSWPPSPRRLDALIEEATVDAYGESEQATAFLTMLEEHLAFPFGATVLGEAVVVENIDLSGADELIAICRRGGKRQKVRLLDLELPVSRPKGAEWIAAYHRWSRL